MGSMSDLLTTRLLEDDGSYLTGYPLKTENAYVLARTWAAREMPRPGSVWTHSLIVDYQTLALLEDPTCLLRLLRRPSMASLTSFSDPIVVRPTAQPEPEQLSPARARAAILDLYSPHPERVVVLSSETREDDERLLMALWRQMWPALRRDTAFFSFADEAHLSVDAACVIHFSATQRRSPALSVASEADAVYALAADLPHRLQTGLRSFVAKHAFDASAPRAAVLPLVRLWRLMSHGEQGATFHALAEALPHANASRLLRTVLEDFPEGPSAGTALLEIVERFGGLQVTTRSDWLASSTNWATEDDLGKVLDRSGAYAEGTLGAAIFDVIAATAPIGSLAIASYNDKTATRLVDKRPELLDERPFWTRQKGAQAALVRMAATIGRPLERVLALVRGTTSIDSVTALLDCWPNRIKDIVQDLGSARDGKRLVGAALGRSPALLERALDAGASLDAELLDEAIGQAFIVNAIPYPPASVWDRLDQAADIRLVPNLAVLAFVKAMTNGGTIGRQTMAHLLPAIREMARSGGISSGARQYLNEALRSKRIYHWSIEDALFEAVVVAFGEGWHVSTDILNSVGRAEIEGIVAAIHGRLGMSEVRDLRTRAMHKGSRVEPWKIRKLDDFLRTRESRWFW